MPKGIYYRTILYMLIAVWALYFLGSVDQRQALAMSAGVVAGGILGLALVRGIFKRK
ncbi:MAG: hypothetical protein GXO27_01300 [Chlorobi bacterium]|nr:hypothetical protein [Chlorobiota bacterium]